MSCQDDHCKFDYVQAEKGFSNSKEHRHGKLNWKRTAASKNGGESVNCLFLAQDASSAGAMLQHVKQLSCAYSTRKSFFMESWTLFRLSDAPRNTHSHHCGPIVQEKIFVWQGIWKDLMWFKFQRLIPINFPMLPTMWTSKKIWDVWIQCTWRDKHKLQPSFYKQQISTAQNACEPVTGSLPSINQQKSFHRGTQCKDKPTIPQKRHWEWWD